MDKAKYGKKVSKHEYDLDLMEALKTFENFPEEAYTRKIPFTDYTSNIKKAVIGYCKSNQIDFDSHLNRIPIVIPSDNDFYDFGLGLYLTLYDKFRISPFLDYQMQHYKGGKNFVKLLEYIVYPIIKDNSPLNDNPSFEAVVEWVKQRKALKQKSTIFDWQKSDEELKTLSTKLYSTGYTQLPTSFFKAIKKNQYCIWKKDTSTLVYFFYKLTRPNLLFIKTKHGRKGYINGIKQIFGDFEAKSLLKSNLKNLSSKINLFPDKYASTRHTIDSLLNYLTN